MTFTVGNPALNRKLRDWGNVFSLLGPERMFARRCSRAPSKELRVKLVGVFKALGLEVWNSCSFVAFQRDGVSPPVLQGSSFLDCFHIASPRDI
jgi:hypothetical protein